MGTKQGPGGTEITKDLDYLGISASKWSNLEQQLKEIEGVEYVSIHPSGRLAYRVRRNISPKEKSDAETAIRETLSSFVELPVGINRRNLQGRRSRTTRPLYVNAGWRSGH